MPTLPLMALALASPLLLHTAPPPGTTLTLLLLALVLAVAARRRPTLRSAGTLILLAGLACATLDHALSLRIVDRDGVHRISGEVVGLPAWRGESLRFDFRAFSGPWGKGERRLEVRWFDASQVPAPGEYWRFDLALASVRGRLNFQGHDAERFALAQGIHGIGRVRGETAKRLGSEWGTRPAFPGFQRLRFLAREHLDAELGGLPGEGLVRALAIGDRGGLSKTLQDDLRGTGTGHLLAISGLHVGLVALFAVVLARGVLALLPWRGRNWPARRFAPLPGLAVATVYAGLAGFGTSPRRALVMVSVVIVALALRRSTGAWRGWWLALVAVLLLDPLAPLSPGFWLSFGAVAVLFLAFLNLRPAPRGLPGLVRAQTVLLPGLLALGIGWFSSASLGAWFVNLVAIPWVSAVTLPLVLVTLVTLPLDGPLPAIAAHMAERSAAGLGEFLHVAHEAVAPLTWTPATPGTATLLLAGVGGLLCLMPGALRLRWLGLALLAPLAFAPPALPPGAVRVEALDVGQGQATWIMSATRALLVDPGPGMPGDWSRVAGTVAPALRAQGRHHPDLVLVTHGDLDHAGGLADVRAHWPRVPVTGNWRSAPPGVSPCHDRRAWWWDQIEFRVLHPSPWLPYLGNDSSCVLQIVAPGGRMLLPGDIGHRVEARLARRTSRPGGAHRLILAPHHGSRSSSSAPFLAWADPDAVVVSVGHGNRFGLPHEDVVARYRERGVAPWTTAACGALRLTLRADGRLEARSARRSRPGPWRYPAGESCP